MELLLILLIVLIVFGAGKLPQLGEGLGKAIKGFKKTVHEADAVDVTPTPDQAGAQTRLPPAQAQSAQPTTTAQQPAKQGYKGVKGDA